MCARQKLIHVVTSRLSLYIVLHSPLSTPSGVYEYGIFSQKIACNICRATHYLLPPYVYYTLWKLCVTHVLHFNSCKQCWNLETKRFTLDAKCSDLTLHFFCCCAVCWMEREFGGKWWRAKAVYNFNANTSRCQNKQYHIAVYSYYNNAHTHTQIHSPKNL